MEFLIGFLGAIVAVGLFFGGAFLGWRVKEAAYARESRVTAEQLTEVQRQQLRDEAEAWKSLHNYSAADAYGLTPEPTTSNKE